MVDAEIVLQKLLQCFNQEGFMVTIAVTHTNRTSPSVKVRRLDHCDQEFKVWSALLCKWSDVFDVMLSSQFLESKGKIEITDFPADVVESCLKFLYSGKLEVEANQLADVAAFADKYSIHEIKEHAKQEIVHKFPSIAKKENILKLNFLPEDFRRVGVTAGELRQVGKFAAVELKGVYTDAELKDACFTVRELLSAGFTVPQLLRLSFGKADLVAASVVTLPSELKETGLSAGELRRAGFLLSELMDSFSHAELKSAGFTLADMSEAGFSDAALKEACLANADFAKGIIEWRAWEDRGRRERRINELEAELGEWGAMLQGHNDKVFGKALHDDKRVEQFLRGPEEALVLPSDQPLPITKYMATSLSSGHASFYTRDPPLCPLNKRTYSVTAKAIKGSKLEGGNRILITKTGDFFRYTAHEYDRRLTELRRVMSERTHPLHV